MGVIIICICPRYMSARIILVCPYVSLLYVCIHHYYKSVSLLGYVGVIIICICPRYMSARIILICPYVSLLYVCMHRHYKSVSLLSVRTCHYCMFFFKVICLYVSSLSSFCLLAMLRMENALLGELSMTHTIKKFLLGI